MKGVKDDAEKKESRTYTRRAGAALGMDEDRRADLDNHSKHYFNSAIVDTISAILICAGHCTYPRLKLRRPNVIYEDFKNKNAPSDAANI